MSTKHFDHIVNRIASAHRQANSLSSGLGHRGLEGEIREIATRDCIEPFLTQSYQCGTGKVIDSFQNISDQMDLIVYHRKVAPPILVNRDLGLYPVECVRYVFEVKTKLTASEVRDANKKFRSIGNLCSYPRKNKDGSLASGPRPSTVLFAFSSDMSGSEIDRYLKHTDDEHPPCTVLCVLGKGYWFYDRDRGWHGREVAAGLPAYTEFCMFITGFMNTLAGEETSIRPFRAINRTPTRTEHNNCSTSDC
jgi:hypothetical protein